MLKNFSFLLLIFLLQRKLRTYASVDECYDRKCCFISTMGSKSIDDVTCYTGSGHDYKGSVNQSSGGWPCINWMETVAANVSLLKHRKYGTGDHNFCRNPEPTEVRGPWCYVSRNNYGYCEIEKCKQGKRSWTLNEVIPPVNCADFNAPMEAPDLVFYFNNSAYYVTTHHGNVITPSFMLYRFRDVSMTSYAVPAVQSLEQAWHLCLRPHDVITFVTSDNSGRLMMYFQYSDVMIELNFTARGWKRVDSDVYKGCLEFVKRAARVGHDEQIIRSIYNFNRVGRVQLQTNQNEFICEWKNDKLSLVGMGKAQFDGCEETAAFFIDKQNNSVSISREHGSKYISLGTGKSPDYQVTNLNKTPEVLLEKPALAAPLLGFEILNNHHLIRLQRLKSLDEVDSLCQELYPLSEVLRVNDGKKLLEIINWIQIEKHKSENSSFLFELNSQVSNKAGFCNLTDSHSKQCCTGLIKKFRVLRNTVRISGTFTSGLAWVVCHLDFKSSTNQDCPELICFGHELKIKNSFLICQISLESDVVGGNVTTETSLSDILGSGGKVTFKDAEEASLKIGEVADSLHFAEHDSALDLSLLIGSVEALEPINYSNLSENGAERLIGDFVTIIDNLSDKKRINEWVEIQNSTAKNSSRFNETQQKAPSAHDGNPESILLLTENVLKSVVTGMKLGQSEASVQSLTFTTHNVISVIEQKYFNDSANFLSKNLTTNTASNKTIDLKIRPQSLQLNSSATVIKSTFPNIINLISQIKKRNENSIGNKDNKNNSFLMEGSPILSATMLQNGRKVPAMVEFRLPFSSANIPDPVNNKFYFSCKFLEENYTWSTRGCTVKEVDVMNSQVICSCNHTTNFALLLQVVPPQISSADLAMLSLLSYIGESISVFCLIITLVTFSTFRRNLVSERMVAHFHLVVALIMFHVIQLFSSQAEDKKNVTVVPCIAVTFLTHFSLLSVFMWMLCEGVTLHLSVVRVFHEMTKFKFIRFFIGWGIPFVISLATLGYGLCHAPYPTCYLEGVGDQSCSSPRDFKSLDAQPRHQVVEKCWLSSENHLVFALVCPAIAVLILNTIVLIRVSIVISQASKATNRVHSPSGGKKQVDLVHVRKSMKGALILMPILGIPWVFGFFPPSLTHIAFLYIFTVLNSLQGVFILLFYCVFNTEVKTVVVRCLRNWNLVQNNSWSSHSSNKTSVRLRQTIRTTIPTTASVKRTNSANTNSTYLEASRPGSLFENSTKISNDQLADDECCQLVNRSDVSVVSKRTPILLQSELCYPSDNRHNRFVHYRKNSI